MSNVEFNMERASASDTSDEQINQARQAAVEITEETLRSIARDTAESVRSAMDEKPKRGFKTIFFEWFNEQVERIGRTVMALLVATVVAILTPYLVKYQLIDEFDSLSSRLSSAVSESDSRDLIQQNLESSQKQISMEQQNLDALNRIEDFNSSLVERWAALDQIQGELENQNVAIAGLSDRVANIKVPAPQPVANQKTEVNKKLSQALTSYKKQGQALLVKPSSERAVRQWLGEVYFFLSVIPSSSGTFDQVQREMQKIYQAEKPYENDQARLEKTLMILSAVNTWVSVSS
ncbi:hypothetical protein [Teredinibacter sp. KSP-S5-2]|uniref:hypothetical protein n=1 Tax=Teredinibacter sp. KSP-S5-2 TaxID=3034506 RepID=UPI0029347157|nr:hypothetical protein [Teredinibacter sp. KSP-S5-2]WNO11024.1 hypothetical protein P5V12_07525 [Teredinibacter sp. KSP-S5-2]